MSLAEGYVASMLHDVKKVLLNNKKSDKENYGKWRPDHSRLDELNTQVDDICPNSLELESGTYEVDMIKFHQGIWIGKKYSRFDYHKFDTIATLSLGLADNIHKSLYFAEEGGGEVRDVNFKLPLFYPFYGDPEGIELKPGETRVKFEAIAEKIRGEKDDKGEISFSPSFLTRLQGEYMRDFLDSAFLPISSLGFHHRFSSAIFLIVYKRLSDIEIFDAKTNKIPVDLYLNTIISPPEKLKNRLVDMPNVRKISHLLQRKVHKYFQREYLNDIKEKDDKGKDFHHPDYNPFLFYNKDAIVVLNDERDQASLENICQEVANETESVITMERYKIRVDTEIKFSSPIPLKRENISLCDIERINPAKVPQDAFKFLQFFPFSISFPEVENDSCFVCGKPGDRDSYLRQDERGDWLCPSCWKLRREYKFCDRCQIYTAQDTCPHCGRTDSMNYLRLGIAEDKEEDEVRGERRVAYIMIKANCSYQGAKYEAGALMAKFRKKRLSRKDLWDTGVNEEEKIRETSTTSFGIFEYLQAVLDISVFQQELRKKLEELYPEDRRKEIEGHFLYLSPSLTVIVIEEGNLPKYYQMIKPLFDKFNISYIIHILTCDSHYPVWRVIREFIRTFDFLSNETTKLSDKINELAKSGRAGKNIEEDFFGMNNDLLSLFEKDRVKQKESMLYTILRGGIERVFGIETMEELLSKEGLKGSKSEVEIKKTQLGNLAQASEPWVRLVRSDSSRENDAKANFLMELDATLRQRDSELAQRVEDCLDKVNLVKMPAFLRELASHREEEE